MSSEDMNRAGISGARELVNAHAKAEQEQRMLLLAQAVRRASIRRLAWGALLVVLALGWMRWGTIERLWVSEMPTCVEIETAPPTGGNIKWDF